MEKEYLNISKLETYLYSVINKVVSNNTYAGTLPDTTQSSWNDMCLIDLCNPIEDMNAFGRGSFIIWLYAKPRANGTKNTATMSKLEEKLNKVLQTASNGNDQFQIISRYSDYDTNRKWHCNIYIIQVNIF